MRYERAAEQMIARPEDVIGLADHRRIPLADGRIAWFDRDSPGWGIVSRDVELALLTACPAPLSALETALQPSVFAGLSNLWRSGLVTVNGQSGITAVSHRAPDAATSPNSILIKMTGACNWACAYCYDYDKDRFRARLDVDATIPVIRAAIAEHPEVSLIFHGGEPLLQFDGLQTIAAIATELAAENGRRVRFLIQTNGALLDDRIIEFLDKYNFGVGVSFDGPPTHNDRLRVLMDGGPTSPVIDKLFEMHPRFMRERVAYLTTVTSVNDSSLADVMRYLRGLGVTTWKLAVFDQEGRGRGRADLAPSVRSLGDFLVEAIEEAANGGLAGFRIVTLIEYLDLLLSVDRSHMCHRLPCGAATDFAALMADGAYYACDATYHEAFHLGRTTSWRELDRTKLRVIHDRENWVLSSDSPCSSCEWLHHCGGTCMAKALIQHGRVNAVDDFECALRKRIFPTLLEHLARPGSQLLQYYDACKASSAAKEDAE